jgi:hypothetical protein
MEFPAAMKDARISEGRTPRAMARLDLTPAETLLLWKPKTAGRDLLKASLLSLVVRGIVRLDAQEVRGMFRTKRVLHARLASMPQQSPAHVESLIEVVRAAETDGGTLDDLVKRARRAYGANLDHYRHDHVAPPLIVRGLIEQKRLLFARYYRPTRDGAAEQARIESDVRKARELPELLASDPAQAAAVALGLGGTILLVPELKPYFRKIDQATRSVADGGDGGVAGFDFGLMTTGGDGGLFASPDGTAFDAFDAGLASFDAGFDASAGGDGDGGDGGGGDGGGGH